jgi:hypothetical protein
MFGQTKHKATKMKTPGMHAPKHGMPFGGIHRGPDFSMPKIGNIAAPSGRKHRK